MHCEWLGAGAGAGRARASLACATQWAKGFVIHAIAFARGSGALGQVKVVVLTGEGKSFCAGIDLSNPVDAVQQVRPDDPCLSHLQNDPPNLPTCT